MQNSRLVGGVLLLSVAGALATASCGSSEEKIMTRGAGGAGGDGGEPSNPVAGSPLGGGAGRGEPSGGAGGLPEASGGAGGDDSGAGAGGESGRGGAGGESGFGGGAGGGAAAGDGGAGGSGEQQLPPRFRVFNTGVDDRGIALAGGLVDPHFTLIQSPDATFTGPDAIVTTHIAEGYWLPQSDASKWIAPSPNQSYPGADPCNTQGVYVWRTTFSVAESELADFTISGGWASDNTGTAVRLNGTPSAVTASGYAALTAFTIEDGFVAGENTLDFEVTDVGCPNGLRVELQASVDVLPG